MTQDNFRVFLIENSPTLRALFATWLEHEGYTVESCSVADAVSYFYECLVCDIPRPRIDAIICEVDPRGDSGLRLLRHVRLLSSDVPTVLLCEHCTDWLRHQAELLGADALFEKPVHRWALATTMRRLLQASSSDPAPLRAAAGFGLLAPPLSAPLGQVDTASGAPSGAH